MTLHLRFGHVIPRLRPGDRRPRTRAWAPGAVACGLALSVIVAPLAGAQSNPEQFRAWPSERPPRPLPAKEVTFPPYEVQTLANGMQVLTVLHHEQPAVTMRLLVRAGAAQDDPQKGGLAGLVANLLDQGTTTRSASQIADEIDSIGGAMGSGSGTDLTFVNAVVMKDSFGPAMELLADVVRNPAFSPDEIDRQKERAISSLQVSDLDPDYVASVLLDRLVYGFHPYGLPGSGTPETLASITQGDLRAFHQRYFVPNNMMLAIVGDVTREEAHSTVERVFGSWPRRDVAAMAPIDPPAPTRRIVVVDKPDSVQTEIRVGQLAIPRRHPDYLAFDLAVKILGGEGANRLHRVLRSERGLTYGASAQTRAMKQAGSFVAETDTRTETTAEVLRLTLDEFARLPRQRVSERELADAQAYLAGSFPLTIETPNDIATQVLNAVFYELPMEEISSFRERVLSVTPDDIQRVARQYIRPDRLSIVLVGNARAFLSDLRGLGFTDIEIIPLDELDLMSATLRRDRRTAVAGPGAPQAQEPAHAAYVGTRTTDRVNGLDTLGLQRSGRSSPLVDPQAAELLARVVAAKGGLTALKAIRTLVADAETTLLIDGETIRSTTKTHVLYPDRFRVDASVAGAQVVQIYNAGNAWVKDPGGVRPAPAAMRDDFAASVRRDTIQLLVGAAEGRLQVRALPDELTNEGTRRVLEVSGPRLDEVRFHVDERGLLTRQIFSVPGPDGRRVRAEEAWSDYRTVDGIAVPFEARLSHDARPVLSRTIIQVAFNAPVAESLFERPR
jgi:zinc protease